jgi:hypothetical protein
MSKNDEILAWEQRKETERDTKFVELGPLSMRSSGWSLTPTG